MLNFLAASKLAYSLVTGISRLLDAAMTPVVVEFRF